jgi:hypothetical protein
LGSMPQKMPAAGRRFPAAGSVTSPEKCSTYLFKR